LFGWVVRLPGPTHLHRFLYANVYVIEFICVYRNMCNVCQRVFVHV